MNNWMKTATNLLLVFLVMLDAVLSTTCLFSPATWFRVLHGAPYVDPQGLLRRTGAVWAAFTLFQFVALLRWRSRPYWLPLVAGIRLTEVFSDCVYLYACSSVTWAGRIGLLVSPPCNVLFALFLLASYRRFMQSQAQV
jgi:hypothetical protein